MPPDESIAFAGIALTEEQSPAVAFSNFDPAGAMFNQHRLSSENEIILFRSPLDAILAVENGAPLESVTSFLTQTVQSPQLEYLGGLLDHLKSSGLLL